MKTLLSQNNLVFNPPILGCVLFLSGLPGSGSKIYDRSPYGNHGTITGATWKRLPSGLWCLYFDGNDDSVSVGDADSLDLTNAITIEAWIYCDSLATHNGIVCRNTNSYAFYLYSTGKFGFGKSGVDEVQSDSTLTIDTWYHIAATRLAGTNTLFLNGNFDKSGTGADFVALTDAIKIGDNYSANFEFSGYIALVRVHNQALVESELHNHFNREKHLFGVW